MGYEHIVRSKLGYYQMPAGYGHYFGRSRDHQFASQAMVLFLMNLSTSWAISELGHPWGLGDISMDGGVDPGHGTHMFGSAVDIYVLNKNNVRRQPSGANATVFGGPDYDAGRTMRLAQLAAGIISRGFPAVSLIFDDPNVQKVVNQGGQRPQMRSARNPNDSHRDHIHIQLHGEMPYTKTRANELVTKSYGQWFFGIGL